MGIFLNIVVLVLCTIWFHRIMNSAQKKLILPVVGVYLVSSLFVFIVTLLLQAEYLDGLLYLISGVVSLLLFWVWTTLVIIIKNVKNGTAKYIATDLAQTVLLLLVPFLLWLLVKDASFKIGG